MQGKGKSLYLLFNNSVCMLNKTSRLTSNVGSELGRFVFKKPSVFEKLQNFVHTMLLQILNQELLSKTFGIQT